MTWAERFLTIYLVGVFVMLFLYAGLWAAYGSGLREIGFCLTRAFTWPLWWTKWWRANHPS